MVTSLLLRIPSVCFWAPQVWIICKKNSHWCFSALVLSFPSLGCLYLPFWAKTGLSLVCTHYGEIKQQLLINFQLWHRSKEAVKWVTQRTYSVNSRAQMSFPSPSEEPSCLLQCVLLGGTSFSSSPDLTHLPSSQNPGPTATIIIHPRTASSF